MKLQVILSTILCLSFVQVGFADHHAAFIKHPAADDPSFTVIYDGKDLSKMKTKGKICVQDHGLPFTVRNLRGMKL